MSNYYYFPHYELKLCTILVIASEIHSLQISKLVICNIYISPREISRYYTVSIFPSTSNKHVYQQKNINILNTHELNSHFSAPFWLTALIISCFYTYTLVFMTCMNVSRCFTHFVSHSATALLSAPCDFPGPPVGSSRFSLAYGCFGQWRLAWVNRLLQPEKQRANGLYKCERTICETMKSKRTIFVFMEYCSV